MLRDYQFLSILLQLLFLEQLQKQGADPAFCHKHTHYDNH